MAMPNPLDRMQVPSDTSLYRGSNPPGNISPSASSLLEQCAREAELDCFPNDLTRLLYLASLRDCNSGRYLHPTVSAHIGSEMASEGLRGLHVQVFWRLLALPVSGFVSQLQEYIRYTRTEPATVLETWQSLEAYRATTPVLGTAFYRNLFCLNIETALRILATQAHGTASLS
jgi:hypothetical protein